MLNQNERDQNRFLSRLLRAGREGLLVLLALAALTALLVYFDLDRRLSYFIHDCNYHWPGERHAPWTTLYRVAAWPAILMAFWALCSLVLPWLRNRRPRHWREAVFLLILLGLGPGLVVNVLLKDHLGRARPKELEDFGGKYAYTGPWRAGAAGSNSSFPSGHAAIGFALIGPWFVLRGRALRPALLVLLAGTCWGGAIGLARMLQGSHFASDVLWSWGLVYLCGLGLDLAFSFGQAPTDGSKKNEY